MISGTFCRLDDPLPSLRLTPIDDGPALRRYPGLAACRDLIGNTTLLDVPSPEGGARIAAKCEFENPAGSVKDRVAYALLCEAIRGHDESGPPLKILDYSGGSLARAFGYLAQFTGIPMRFTLPAFIPPSWLRAIEAYGVQTDLVDGTKGIMGIVDLALDIAAQDPSWTLLYQHRNLANVAVHLYGTGHEILRQLGDRKPTHWMAGIGSAGTLAGVALALRAKFPDLAVAGITPAEMPYGTPALPNTQPKFSGGGGLGYGLRHPFVESFVPDTTHITLTAPEAFSAMCRFLDLTGIRIGSSSAANWLAAWRLAETLPPDALVLTVFADAGPPEEWERAISS
ncbi:pyridoxal-phosphate dependent enzyme [Planotetraspora sp. A-T 1434]|uniref:PLP-dependent cysteine synthase family protein n=1 Tax=Planotetraspora sp. A-T 1434 TaxID=2979219 RepID=UPI0021C169D4|nr:pyridoxal-phosphate dependent enzyme [Planotetraspora sp. A-T 1434]MCT9933574.1 pyridoxal-phosphate dependent enzyme [Planotetraspora sp. A-T 1434]